MHDCPSAEIRDLLPDLLHDQLDPTTRAEIERHVTTCVDCAEELALLRRVRGVLARAPRIDVARIAAAASAAKVTPRPRHGFTRSWRAAAAVAAVLIGSLGVVFGSRYGDAGQGSSVAMDSTHPAGGGGGGGSGATSAETGLVFGGGVSDLETSQLETLLSELDHLDTTPVAEPSSVSPSITGGVS